MNMQFWKIFVSSEIPQWVRGVGIGVLTFVITAPLSYYTGYHAGYKNGALEAGIDASAELTKRRQQEERSFRENLAKERREFDERLAKDSQEHAAKLEEIVLQRYGDKLVEERENGRVAGQAEGKTEGFALGRKDCDAECTRTTEELKDYGALWEDFVSAVNSHADKKRTETGIRSSAEAIIEIAHTGRQATSGLAKQLDGIVDAINAALQAGDLEKVNELVKALQASLKSKGIAWRANFRRLTVHENP